MNPPRLRTTAAACLAAAALLVATLPTPTSGATDPGATGAGTHRSTTAERGGWRQVGAWEFSSDADLGTWQHRNAPAELQTGCKGKAKTGANSRSMNRSDGSVVSVVSPGYLKLGLRQVRCKGKKRVLYVSGHVGTESTFGLATTSPWRIQARIKFPRSVGNHASLWTRAIGAPIDELDIAETYGVRPAPKCPIWTNFYADYDKATGGDKQKCLGGRTGVPRQPTRKWHFYRADIFPGEKARIYIDGRKVYTFGAKHTPDVNSFMILSNLVNDCAMKPCGQKRVTTTGPKADMYVDWVRLSTR